MTGKIGNDNKEGASNLLGLFATPPANDEADKKSPSRKESDYKALQPVNEELPLEQSYQTLDRLRSCDDINEARADMDAPTGSISYMMGLFSAPNYGQESIFPSAGNGSGNETMPLLVGTLSSWKDTVEKTPKSSIRSRKHTTALDNGKSPHHIRLPSLAMPIIEETVTMSGETFATAKTGWTQAVADLVKLCAKEAIKPTTLIGAFMFLLYHVVFSLALGSAINRPHSSTSLLGLMTQTAALGTISSSAIYWWFLGSEIPALYPTAVCFTCQNPVRASHLLH